MTRKIDISRDEAEALVDLIDAENAPWPLDQLAIEIRALFGMCTKEVETENKKVAD